MFNQLLKHGGKLAIAAVVVTVAVLATKPAHSTVALVRINGVATPVNFNDGDTFKPLAGPYRRRAARLAGFNTLESYGPVHQWGGWTFKELYVNAKQATLNARRGKWSCEVDPTEKDAYGRLLAQCKDLAIDHVVKGLAHALSVDGPAKKFLIRAQRRAIVKRRGMWAKGVPPLVLTSLHSADERIDNSTNYNRLVSPLDGASTKWMHQDEYGECERVCHPAIMVDNAGAAAVIKALRADDVTGPIVKGYEDPYLRAMFNEYLSVDRVAFIFAKDAHVAIIKRKLDTLKKAGTFAKTRQVEGSCMVYASFARRYRVKPKPKCLK